MRSLLLVLACGCTVAGSDAANDPDESEVSSLSVIAPCQAGQWCSEGAPAGMAPAPKLHAVFAIDASDVFAVGDSGTILRRQDNNDWVAMVSGTSANLRSVWASSSSDVWVGGPSGVVLHFDGDDWSSVGGASSNIDSIWGSSASDVWFVGSTVVLHWNGSGFSQTGFGGTLVSVSGSGPGDVWVTGETTNLHHYNGTSWSTVTVSGAGSTLMAMFARTVSDVWAADLTFGKETAHWNGTKWVTIRTNGVFFQSIAGESANDVWGVGNSKVGHWTGTAWTFEEPFGTNAALWSVTSAPGNLWLVGDGGLIAHRTL